MINLFFHFAQSSFHRGWIECMLFLRSLWLVGRKYECPCCGWHLRAFTQGGTSMKTRHCGYCPRCNSKARHRRDWLFLKEHTNLFSAPVRLLHVSPKYALSRRLTRMPNIDFVGVDIEPRPNVTRQVDIRDIPFETHSMDAAICIHVLEHVDDDRRAIAELFRVIKPGGWALISVPLRLESPHTLEDPSITSPEDRKKHFGEEQHVRWYGSDFPSRLAECGFTVDWHRGDRIDKASMTRFGLLDNENVFFCHKA